MKIIRRVEDGVVLYVGDDLTIDDAGVYGDGWRHPGLTGVELIEATESPADYLGSCYAYAGAWSVIPARQADIDARNADRSAGIAALKAAFIIKVDADVDEIIDCVIGCRGHEYAGAESDAIAFKAGGYSGTAPDSVLDHAGPKNQTAQWAADDIIATATAWRGAQTLIRRHRLARKEAARNAADLAALDAIEEQWAGFVAIIRGQLGIS